MNNRLIIYFLILIFTFLIFAFPAETKALSGNQFQSGRIIDNNVFFNGNDMDIPSIQAFLNSKVPICDSSGLKPSNHPGYSTRAEWGAANGYPAPYICLKDFTISTYGIASDSYCNGLGYGIYTAAGVIYSAAKACNINPKVLIVLLQKEQGLVADEWPWPIEYAAATGYGCPDTANCDPSYKGFLNQVYFAARQYNIYSKNPSLFNYAFDKNGFVGFSPNSACGGSYIYMQNQATAGLYNYTPYVPNQAALNNLYGTGDSCSAYGNRNFWRLYNDWFGSTFGIPFAASFSGESNVSTTVTPSSNGSMYFDIQNNGSQFWKDDSSALPYYPRTRLVADWPLNRYDAFYDPSSWLSPNRPVSIFTKVFENDGVTLTSDQHTVWPGQIARFSFSLKYPQNGIPPGTYPEHFEVVQDGISNWWVPGSGVWQNVIVPGT